MKAGHESVGGGVIDLDRRADLLHDALLHHDHAVGQGHRLDLVVGHVDRRDRQFVAEVLDLGPRRYPQLGIEVGQRFVHQEHVGFAHDGAGKRHTLTLPTGQFGRLAVQEIVQLDHCRGAAHLFVMGFGVDTAHLQWKADVFIDVHIRIERVALEHHGHVAILGLQVIDPLAIDQDFAIRGILQPRDHSHRRGFSTARRPQQHKEFPVCNGEIKVLNPTKLPQRLLRLRS